MSLRVEAQAPAGVLAAMRAPFEALTGARAGGEAVDPPMLLPLSTLLDLAGEAMRARLFVVQGEGGEPAALRPDVTIAVAQAHIASGKAAGRYRYEGKAFRAAPPGSGRATEFLQLGVEMFGPSGAAEDEAVLAAAWTAAAAGGRGDLSVVLGDVGLFSGFIGALGLPERLGARLVRAFAGGQPMARELERAQGPARSGDQGRLAALLADLPEAEGAGVIEEMWKLAGVQPVGGRSAGEIAHRLVERAEAARTPPLSAAEAGLISRFLAVSAPPREAFDRLATLAEDAKASFMRDLEAWNGRLKALDAAGAPAGAIRFEAGFVRPFGYYDGMLFEVRSAALGPDLTVAAGGRYDALLPRLGGGAAGAVGCMVRPGRAWTGGGA